VPLPESATACYCRKSSIPQGRWAKWFSLRRGKALRVIDDRGRGMAAEWVTSNLVGGIRRASCCEVTRFARRGAGEIGFHGYRS